MDISTTGAARPGPRKREGNDKDRGGMRSGGDSRFGRGGEGGGFQKRFHRKKFCRFCADKVLYIDYKDVRLLRGHVTERGKIMPRRLTGTCAIHQRELCRSIKLARNIALLSMHER